MADKKNSRPRSAAANAPIVATGKKFGDCRHPQCRKKASSNPKKYAGRCDDHQSLCGECWRERMDPATGFCKGCWAKMCDNLAHYSRPAGAIVRLGEREEELLRGLDEFAPEWEKVV